MNYEDAQSLASMFAYLMLKALRMKYGEEFEKELCSNLEAYPLAGVASILLEANVTTTCPEASKMLSTAEYPPQFRSLLDEVCKGKTRTPKELFIKLFERSCNEKGLVQALRDLTEVSLSLLNDEENEVLRVMLGRLPQAILYAQKYNVDVKEPLMRTALLATMFTGRVMDEVAKRLESCEESRAPL